MLKIYTFCLILVFNVLSNSFVTTPGKDFDSLLFFSGDAVFFLNNLEYYNEYREGEPFFGSYLQLRVSYKPFSLFTFSVGVHTRKDIGDESFVSDIRPLFRGHYHYKDFSFIFGELLYKKRHYLLDALLREQFIYNPVVEEGIQFLFKNAVIYQDTWGIYPALNTPEHREKLCVGNSTFISVGPVRFSMMMFITHFGGQLFAPENDPVRENVTASIGLDFSRELAHTNNKVGIEHSILGSSTTDTTQSAQRKYDGGWGSISKIWMQIKGFEVGISFYKGFDYTTWEGNPMYQSNEPYYFIEVSKVKRFPKNIVINFGLRLDFMDMYPHQFFNNGDHQIWLSMRYSFDRIIR